MSSATGSSDQNKSGRLAYVISQVLVRAVLLVLMYTIMFVSGALASDGVVTQRGTAVATSCERVGPISLSGLGWYWRCDAEVTWADGSKEETFFKNSELTPRNKTEPAPVAWREVDKAGHMITVENQRSFAGFGWAMVIALFPAVVMGVQVPGIPPLSAEVRAERRKRTRLQLWQPLVLPVGWGMLIAGGLATGAAPVLPGAAVTTIVLAYVVLVVAANVHGNRRGDGVAEPPMLSPERQAKCLRGGKLLCGVGLVGVLLGLWAGWGNWLGTIGVVAGPLALAIFGVRLITVTRRHVQQLDGTAQRPSAS